MQRDIKKSGVAQCQRCLKYGHYTYECTNEVAYRYRPSRTVMFKQNMKMALNTEKPPEVRTFDGDQKRAVVPDVPSSDEQVPPVAKTEEELRREKLARQRAQQIELAELKDTRFGEAGYSMQEEKSQNNNHRKQNADRQAVQEDIDLPLDDAEGIKMQVEEEQLGAQAGKVKIGKAKKVKHSKKVGSGSESDSSSSSSSSSSSDDSSSSEDSSEEFGSGQDSDSSGSSSSSDSSDDSSSSPSLQKAGEVRGRRGRRSVQKRDKRREHDNKKRRRSRSRDDKKSSRRR